MKKALESWVLLQDKRIAETVVWTTFSTIEIIKLGTKGGGRMISKQDGSSIGVLMSALSIISIILNAKCEDGDGKASGVDGDTYNYLVSSQLQAFD